ncbi:hypothetical protein BGZ83_007445 [Gryganskiella cystojenkinii]|nr:hypothetical protein BGZ83_007445 [Gryganskiella cystojenkinii]
MTDLRWMARKRAQNHMVKEKKTDAGSWVCCDLICTEASSMFRHIAEAHPEELDQQTEQEQRSLSQQASAKTNKKQEVETEFKVRRAEKYGSDPISMDCDCDPSLGTVILFYAYLPTSDPAALASSHRTWSQDLGLCGKVKVAHEGINGTLAGPSLSIAQYIDELSGLPEFKSLRLSRTRSAPASSSSGPDDLDRRRYNFFKPTPGCIHAFGGVMSIKVVDEICPLGAPELSVFDDPLNKPGKLPPAEFHAKLKEIRDQKDAVVLDVRNYYESSIGHFPGAVMPPIRKFSSFRDYIDRNRDQFAGKTILSYCTGGIRW